MDADKKREYVIFGAGGHATVVADILLQSGCIVKGFLDDAIPIGTKVLESVVIGKTENCVDYPECLFLIGIGDNAIRKRIAQVYPVEYGVAIHPAAVVGRQVNIGVGSILMAGCIVNTGTVIGEHCIINTSSSIDHDNKIGDIAHISPGAVLGGTVVVGSGVHIGLGACIKNNITVCNDAVVGVGAVVVKDIMESGVYTGIPAKRI